MSSRSNPPSTAAVVVGLLMAVSFLGLTHDLKYLESSEQISVERGAGLDEHEELEKNVNAAPIHRKLAFVMVCCVGLYAAATSRRSVRFEWGLVPTLMGMCLAMVLASWVWSVGRGETVREIVRIGAYLFIAAALARRFRPHEICLILAMMCFGSVLTSVGVEIVTGNFRPWQNEHRLHGSIHSNVFASHAMVAALAAFTFLKSSRRRWLLASVLVAMVTGILLSKTRGALATTLMGCTAVYFAGRPLRSSVLVVSLLCMFACSAGLAFVLADSGLQTRAENALLLGRSEGATTLTGRLPLWAALWEKSAGRRWLGFGYGAFWTVDRMRELNKDLGWYPGHSHSVYLHTMLDIGLVGAALMLSLAGAGVWQARRLVHRTGDPAYKFVLGLLAAGFVDGLVEVSFVYPRGLGLLVAMALFVLVTRHPALATAKSSTFKQAQPREDSLLASPNWKGTVGG